MPHARKEHRKLPLLKAFARMGTIARAAKACRLSRDAVYDWRRNDPSFERAFHNARRKFKEGSFDVVRSSVGFCKDVIQPLIPLELWPKVSAELAIAIMNLERDIKEGRPVRAVPSENMAEVSLSRPRFADVAIPDGDRDPFATF